MSKFSLILIILLLNSSMLLARSSRDKKEENQNDEDMLFTQLVASYDSTIARLERGDIENAIISGYKYLDIYDKNAGEIDNERMNLYEKGLPRSRALYEETWYDMKRKIESYDAQLKKQKAKEDKYNNSLLTKAQLVRMGLHKDLLKTFMVRVNSLLSGNYLEYLIEKGLIKDPGSELQREVYGATEEGKVMIAQAKSKKDSLFTNTYVALLDDPKNKMGIVTDYNPIHVSKKYYLDQESFAIKLDGSVNNAPVTYRFQKPIIWNVADSLLVKEQKAEAYFKSKFPDMYHDYFVKNNLFLKKGYVEEECGNQTYTSYYGECYGKFKERVSLAKQKYESICKQFGVPRDLPSKTGVLFFKVPKLEAAVIEEHFLAEEKYFGTSYMMKGMKLQQTEADIQEMAEIDKKRYMMYTKPYLVFQISPESKPNNIILQNLQILYYNDKSNEILGSYSL